MRLRRSAMLCLLSACSVPELGWQDAPFDAAGSPSPHGAVTGTVTGPQGTPVAGAHVTTDPRGYESTTTDHGAFFLDRLDPGIYGLVVAAEGLTTLRVQDIAVEVDTDAIVDVSLAALPRTGRLTVLVEGPDGLPLPGARVEASSGSSATTDVDGVATFDALPVGDVDLVVSDAPAKLWPRSVNGVAIGAARAAAASVQLSGRPSPGSSIIGNGWCVHCHPDLTARHADGPHGRALRTTVDGPLWSAFEAGTLVDLASGTARLDTDADDAILVVTADDGDARTFVVDGLLGDPRGGSVPFAQLGDVAWPLPIAWRAADPGFGGWSEGAEAVLPWEEATWLRNGAFTYPPGGTPDRGRSADTRCFACHATGFEIELGTDGAVDLSTTLSTGERWGEAGVGCERCHGPGSSHVTAAPAQAAFRITRPDRLDLEPANDVCNQCHAMTQGSGTLPYPWTSGDGLFEPGADLHDFGTSVPALWASGAAAAPGAQGDELARSPHGPGATVALRCIDCHDAHGDTLDGAGDPLPAMLRQDHRDNALCASCHLALTFGRSEHALERHWAHFGYDPAGPQMRGRCTECHMPQTAARVGFHATTATGDLASHLFEARPPRDAVDIFDQTGRGLLAPGAFPIPGCPRCHTWNAYLAEQEGSAFFGPLGVPGLRETYFYLQLDYVDKFR